MEDTNGVVYTSLVTSKTRVASGLQYIPRLELNGASILAQLLSHCKKHAIKFRARLDRFYHCFGLDSRKPRRFKVYVGNRTADCWSHVVSEENPADCASRGLFPSELFTSRFMVERTYVAEVASNSVACRYRC